MASIEKRVSDDGKETAYRVKIRLRGQAPETATFERLTDAKEWAKKTEADMKAGRHFGISKRHTVEELLDRYEKSALPALKSAESVKAKLDFWRERHGKNLLSDMTPDVIAKARDKLASTPKQRGGGIRSAADVNRTLAALSSACGFAVKELGWLERNPMERVRKGAEAKGRVRFLSSDELPLFLKACRDSANSHLYLAVVLALTTGGRKSEVMSLRWRQIDMKRRTAMLGDTKNGDARALPLSGEALALLQASATVRALDDDRLFPPKPRGKSEFMDLRAPFDGALKVAGITDFHWHDLRHTAASYLAMAGTSPLEIAKVLGHRTMAMVARYSHLSQGRVVELGDLLAARMGMGKA
ncbi:site-specific recombinase, phage integrase family [Oxalobacteraceae bacterium IMCC9480]|nr:site-specific recombinase, phage integrase family [Oxalobacteraceae bacterium IMCC9480]NDP58707.1 site-specific integrase [Oxalobacteraceae bacterium]